MKVAVFDTTGASKGSIDLPQQFSSEYRPDLIRRAVLTLQNNQRTKYGASPEAGFRHSARISKRRRDYRGCYGHGISRVPRKIMSRRGERMNWVGAIAPGTVGGRRAHPPKAEKNWSTKINKKEKRAAIRSALAATMTTELVQARGHAPPKDYPFIVDQIEDIKTTKMVIEALSKLGFDDELNRVTERKIRAGKGKLRGRKYKSKVGPLIVISKECGLERAARNIPGVEVALVNELNAELLAPGTHAGRLTLFSRDSIQRIEKEGLYDGSN
ncbi:MAG: 50S ribosomal protein L4 [archaeon]